MARPLTGEVAEADDRLFVRSVGKAFRLLESFADHAGPLTLTQLATAIQVDKSGAQRLAHTLTQLGYLEKAKGGFRPGRRLLERSFDYLRGQPIVSRAVPILAELRRSVGERVDLSLFDDTAMIYLVRLQSKRESFYAHLNGRRVPTYCTAGGRSVLAHLAPEAALDIVRRSNRTATTPKTVTSVDETMQRVAEAGEAGYAIALEQVWLGEIACGAAILDETKRPVAAIHVVGSIAEWTLDDFIRRIAPLTRDAARSISF